MSREIHVPFCEGLGVRFPRATRLIIFVRSPRAGSRVMASVKRFIEHKLRLVINEDKNSVNAPFNLTFLGFCLRKDAKGKVSILISPRTAARLSVRLRELTPRNWGAVRLTRVCNA